MLPANLPPKCCGFTANANQPSSPDVDFLSTGARGVAGYLYVEVGTGGGGGGGGGAELCALEWAGGWKGGGR